jgi:putative ABC transport system permease protein
MILQTIRALRRAPGVSIAAVLTLALGIAFTTTMFSVVDAVLLKPLPFRDSERVVSIGDVHLKTAVRNDVSASNFADLAARTKTLEAPSLWIAEPVTVAGSGLPDRVMSLRVSPSLFQAFGVGPILGRAFVDADVRTPVIVLGHAYWQRRFGGDRAILGRSVVVDGVAHTVVGVLPAHFRYPDAEVALWQPLVLKDFEQRFRGKRMFQGVARLAPGASLARAKAEIAMIAGSLAQQFPDNRDWTTDVRIMRDHVARDPRPLWLLFGAALLVLVLACANVGNLLLARASATRGEMEIRTALGATRADILRHYLREAAVLATAGTIGGVFLAWRLIELVAAIRPAGLPTWNTLTLDVRALAAAAIGLLLATFAAAIVPALGSSRDLALRVRGVAAERGARVRRVLTTAQVALAVVLLVSAVLLVRSMDAITSVETGFDPGGRVAASLVLPDNLYDRPKEIAFFTTLLDRVRALPGVVSAGGVTALPLHRAGVDYSVETYVDGFTPGVREPEADFRAATPDYFRTMGIPLVAGRELLATDGAKSPQVAIVNEAFVRAYASGREPVGLNVRLYCEQCDPYRIVGVVRDTRHRSLAEAAAPEVYIPYTQMPHGELTLVVRAQGDPLRVASAMRQELGRLDPHLALSDVATLDDIVLRSVDERRFNTQLLAAFSLCALLLAAVGLYGSLSFSIGERRRELAVRVALGASASNVWRLVFAEAATPVAIGLGAGVAGAALAATGLRAMMFGVTATDPLTYAVVVATFGAIVLVVAWAGFRRVRLDDVTRLLTENS